MADEKAVDDIQYDDDGKPIVVKKEVDEGKEGADSEDKGADDKGEAEFDDTAEPVISVRQSNLQHIITRKNETIKKLKSKADDKEDEHVEIESDEEDNLTEDARGAIDRAVEKKIKPIVDNLVSKADEDELKRLFTDDPEAKKYEKHIKAYMGHDSYRGVSPEVIYHHLAFNAAQSIGAKKKQVADKEAGLSKGAGRGLPLKTSAGELPTAEDIAGMTDAEFEAMETDVRQGKYIKR